VRPRDNLAPAVAPTAKLLAMGQLISMECVIFVCASRICGVHRLARKNLLGGWQISGNYWYASGTPVQIVGDWRPPGFQQRLEPSHPKFGVKLSFRRLRRRIDAGGLNRSTV
jgi:hypothetical protein